MVSENEDFDRSAVLGLVADVGGTHIRFGVAVGGDESTPVNVHCVRRFPVRAHESLAHAAEHYRRGTPGVPAALRHAAVAVAGRVEKDHVQLTVDMNACIHCGICAATCATQGYAAVPFGDVVRKLHNYECTRDMACERNCPTGAIRLGNL